MAVKIGIISDTHGLLRQEVVEILKECRYILHAGDVTDPDLRLVHIKNSREIKDYILKQSEQERLKRKTLNMQQLDGNPGMSRMAETDSCH